MPNLEAPRLAHEAETAPHGASADAIAKSLALRTATGTLKAAKATANDELVNLELLNEMERKANAELTKEFKKADNELAEIIRAGKPAISSDNFELQEEAERGKELNARVNETAAYHNALRNERGSLAVPEAVSDTEAVNKKQLETHVSEKIAGIVDTLTQKITTAEAAQAEAVKKAKAEATQYTDGKLADYYTKAEIDESQRVQNERIKKLEAARPTGGAGTFYDFARADAVKTGETIKLSDGTVKDIYRLCVERENVQGFFVTVAETPTQIIGIKGTVQIGNTFANIYADYEIVLEANKITFFRKDTTKTYSKVFVIVDCIF